MTDDTDELTPEEKALIERVNASTSLAELDASFVALHDALPPHPMKGRHWPWLNVRYSRSCLCPVGEAYTAKRYALKLDAFSQMTPMQLVEYMLEHGRDLFDEEFGPDEDARDRIRARFDALKMSRPNVEAYHAELRDVAEHAGAIVASGLPLFTTSEILNPFYAAGAVRIRKGESE